MNRKESLDAMGSLVLQTDDVRGLYEKVGGTGHYLNRRSEYGSTVLELLRRYADRLRAPSSQPIGRLSPDTTCVGAALSPALQDLETAPQGYRRTSRSRRPRNSRSARLSVRASARS
jgi:hypothetical protein